MTNSATEIPKSRTLILALTLAVLGCLWLAAQASAGVYWSSMSSTVGRADSDGSNVKQNFITGASQSWGVATDKTHIYWANFSGHTIGRAKLDGTEIDQNFVTNVEATALAVAAGHIYWTDDGPRSIGRAKLDGTEVEKEFIADAGTFAGLAANSEFLYWGHPEGEGTIARARLDGSDFEPAFIDPAGPLIPYGVVADENHVYWANSMNDSIGRADVGGCAIEEEFIAGAHPAGVAVDGRYIYWGRAFPPEAIGRADLDGSDIQSGFVPGASAAFGLATDTAPATLATDASPGVSLGGTIHGTAVLTGADAPTGTITFDLYGPEGEVCGAAPLSTSTVSVSGNGSYESAGFKPTQTGTYRWQASYSGDPGNDPLAGVRSGTVTVKPAAAPAPLRPALTAPASSTPWLALYVGKRDRDRRAGKTGVTVGVSGPGELTLSGKHVKGVTSHVSGTGRTKLAISPTGALARRLEHHAARTKLRIAFTPTGETTLVKQAWVRLARRSAPAH